LAIFLDNALKHFIWGEKNFFILKNDFKKMIRRGEGDTRQGQG